MKPSKSYNSLLRICISLTILLPALVRAQPVPNDAAQYHYELGIAAAERNNYGKALEEFQTSYAIRQVPRLLINIGRAHHRLGNLREAIDVYESYLRTEPEAAPQIIAQVDEYLKSARAELQTIQAKKPAPEKVYKTIFIKEVQTPRPKWRWFLGSALTVGGLAVLSLGTFSLAHDGRCASDELSRCESIYDTKSVGIPLLLTGGLTLAAGVVTLAWPGKKMKWQTEQL